MKISKHFNINNTWTLFLDRDGVINELRRNDYVKNKSEFIWIDGAIDAIVFLSKQFLKTIIVTNQQGIGKGLFTIKDVENIHQTLQKTIKEKGGNIDKIFYAPQLKSENSVMRKPNNGMALEAKKHFPEIDFKKSLMIGDSLSDMEFAESVGMQKILIEHIGYFMPFDGLKFNSLKEIAENWQ